MPVHSFPPLCWTLLFLCLRGWPIAPSDKSPTAQETSWACCTRDMAKLWCGGGDLGYKGEIAWDSQICQICGIILWNLGQKYHITFACKVQRYTWWSGHAFWSFRIGSDHRLEILVDTVHVKVSGDVAVWRKYNHVKLVPDWDGFIQDVEFHQVLFQKHLRYRKVTGVIYGLVIFLFLMVLRGLA